MKTTKFPSAVIKFEALWVGWFWRNKAG